MENGSMNGNTWRTGLAHDSRQKIVKRIMDTLQRHVPPTGEQSNMQDLAKIAWRFEEKIYTAASDQQDYLRRISLKMLALETKAQTAPTNAIPGRVPGPPNGGTPLLVPNQVNGVQLNGTIPTQNRAQMMNPSLQNNGNANVMQGSQSLANMSGMPQASMSTSSGQSIPLSAAQRMVMQRDQQQQQQRQQQQPQQQASQQPSVNQHQLYYQQRMQQQQMFNKQQQQQKMQQQLLQQQQQVPTLQQQQAPNQLMSSTGAVSSTLQQQQQQQLAQMVQQKQHQQQHQNHQQQQSQQQPAATLLGQSQQPQQSQQSNQPQQLSQQQQQQLQHLQAAGQQLGPQAQQQRLQQQGAINQQSTNPYELQHQKPRVFSDASIGSVDPSGHAGAVNLDQRDVVWPKLQLLKEKYLQDMTELYHMLSSRSQLPVPPEQLQKLNHYKEVLQRMIPYLKIPKEKVPPEFNQDKVEAFEKSIVNIIETFKRRRQNPAQAAPVQNAQLQPNQVPQVAPQQQQIQPQQAPPQQQQHHELLSQMQMQDNKQMLTGVQSGPNAMHQNSLSAVVQNVGPSIQQQGGPSLQHAAVQPHPSALQNSASQQGMNNSLQATGNAAMAGSGMGSMQQANMNPLQQNVPNSLQPNALNSLQSSGPNALQTNVVNNLQQPNAMQQQSQQQQQPNVNTLQTNAISSLLHNASNMNAQQSNPLQQQHLSQVQQQAKFITTEEQRKQLQQRYLQQQQQKQQQQQQQKQLGQIPGQQHVQHSQQLPDFSGSDAVKDNAALKAKQQAAAQQMLAQQQQQQQQHMKKQLYQHQQLLQQQQQQHQLQQQLQQQPQQPSLQQPSLQQPSLPQPPSQQPAAQQLKVGSPPMTSQLVSSPQVLQAASPQISQPMSPPTDHQAFSSAPPQQPKTSTPLQAATPPLKTPSPSMLPASSPSLHEEFEAKTVTPAIATPGSVQTLQSAVATPSNISGIGTPGPSVSPLVDFPPSPAVAAFQDGMQGFSPGQPTNNMDPLERLIAKIDSISPRALSLGVGEMNAVISCNDKLATSAPGNGSRAAVGEDLSSMTKLRLQTRIPQDANNSTSRKRPKRLDSVPLTLVLADGTAVNSLHRAEGFDTFDSGPVVMSHVRSPKLKVSSAIQEEINSVNDNLIDTEITVSEEATLEAVAQGKEGIAVEVLYTAAAVRPSINKQKMAMSLPRVWLLIPPTYPHTSPSYWNERMDADGNLTLNSAAREEFSRKVRTYPAPVSLRTMAACWDTCARDSVIEFITVNGGGTLSSTVGVWDTYLTS